MAFNIIDGEVRITDENGNVVTTTPITKSELTPDVITYVLSTAVEHLKDAVHDGNHEVLPTTDSNTEQILMQILVELKKMNMHLASLTDDEIHNFEVE